MYGSTTSLTGYASKLPKRVCQLVAHRPQHEKECKKRAAELHDQNGTMSNLLSGCRW